jgi:hypothetical protein
VVSRPACPSACAKGRSLSWVSQVLIEGWGHVQVAAPPGCEARARRFFGGLAEIDAFARAERQLLATGEGAG